MTGCASRPQQAWTPTGDLLVDGPAAVAQGPPRDAILWQYRTAAAAMRRGNYALARQMLDPAIARLNSLYDRDRSARRSRSYFVAESKKTFVGEPYERVMAYYYRGILYWMDGEPDNARACFRSAQLMDSDTENRQYAADYVLLDYLDGLVTTKLGGDGTDAFQRAQSAAKERPLQAYDPRVNVLVFHECGQGPTKYATGQYAEQLRFHPGQSAAQAVRITSSASATLVGPWDDLTYQATTRGGRVMDHVLANKAVFKSATGAVGDLALISSVILATDRRTDEAALGLAAFGLLSKVVSAATTPRADTRAWDNLPQHIGFTALALPPGTHPLTIEFLDAQGRPIPQLKQDRSVTVSAGGSDVVLFLSDRNN